VPAKPVSSSANNLNPAGTKRYASTKDLVEAAMAAKNAQPPAPPPPQQQQQIDTSAAPLLSGIGVRHTESFGDSEFGDLDDEGFIAVNMNEIDCGPPIHYEEEEHDMTVEVPQPRSAFSLRDTPFGQPSLSRHVTFNPRVGNNSTTTSAPSRPVQPSSGGQFVFPDTVRWAFDPQASAEKFFRLNNPNDYPYLEPNEMLMRCKRKLMYEKYQLELNILEADAPHKDLGWAYRTVVLD
jgi:hypothetical protein